MSSQDGTELFGNKTQDNVLLRCQKSFKFNQAEAVDYNEHGCLWNKVRALINCVIVSRVLHLPLSPRSGDNDVWRDTLA